MAAPLEPTGVPAPVRAEVSSESEPGTLRPGSGTAVALRDPVELMRSVASGIDRTGPVAVAHDLGSARAAAARRYAEILGREGVEVYALGEMPVPGLTFTIRRLRARAGVWVSSAPRPAHRAEVRIFGPDGTEISPDSLHAVGLRPPIPALGGGMPSPRVAAFPGGPAAAERYLDSIVDQVDRAAIRKAALRVVLDCDHGSSAIVGPSLLGTRLGCRVTTLRTDPPERVSGPRSEPREMDLHELARAVTGAGAAVGFAHDADSDQVTFVDETGASVDGAIALALFARETLRRQPGATIVTSIGSSSAVEEVVGKAGGRLVVTRSGPAAIAFAIAEHHAAFGGEEDGRFVWPEHQNSPDGPMSSARLIELLVREGRPLSTIVQELPSRTVQRKDVPLPDGVRAPVMERAASRLAREATRTVTIDGVKAFFPDGWLLLLPHEGAPVCQVSAEGLSADRAEALLSMGATLVHDLVAALSEEAGSGDLWCDPA